MIYPKRKSERIAYFKSKGARWGAHAEGLRVRAEDLDALGTKVTAAETALANLVSARETARTATSIYNNAVADMTKTGAVLISQIRSTALAEGDSIYELAQIPAPAEKAPTPPPGQPYDFAAVLLQNGTLDLTWKCDNSKRSGAVYHIYRKDDVTGKFIFLGGQTVRKFTDTQVPSGVATLTYRIQAVRASGVGQDGEFNVNFGTGFGPQTVTTVSAPKLAA